MEFYEFSQEEVLSISSCFPELKIVRSGVWEGIIEIHETYREYRIRDRYAIRIETPVGYPSVLPVLSEIGGRTKAIAKKRGLTDLRSLHCNPHNETACVCVKQEEKLKFPSGSSLVHYLRTLAIPYLYGLSFYDEQGCWPWKEYSHGGIGLLEFYADDPTDLTKENIEEVAASFRAEDQWKEYAKQIRKPSANRGCVCGSGKPFRKCHADAWMGVLRLVADLKRLGIDPYKLYRR